MDNRENLVLLPIAVIGIVFGAIHLASLTDPVDRCDENEIRVR